MTRKKVCMEDRGKSCPFGGLLISAALLALLALAAAADAQAPPWQASPGYRPQEPAAKATALRGKPRVPLLIAARNSEAVQLPDEPFAGPDQGVEMPWPGEMAVPGPADCDYGGDGGCRHGYGYWNDPASDRGYPCRPNWPAVFRPLYFRGDYLLWWTDGFYVPPLVATSEAIDEGILGEPSTEILFGDQEFNDGARSGGRFVLGLWFDPCKWAALEVSLITLGDESTSRSFDSDGDPLLARPFFDINAGAWASHLVASPTRVGFIDVDARSKFDVLDLLLRRALINQPCYRLDLLLGFRSAKLKDELRIFEGLTVEANDPQWDQGTEIEVFDQFDTRNRFNGFAFGIAGRARRRCWTLELEMRLALGNTHTDVFIYGEKTIAPWEGDQPDGGALALPSNTGRYRFNSFSAVPEVGVTLAYDVTCRLRATVGYRLIYWSQVARPGDQIDLDLDPDQFVGEEGLRPEFSLVTTDFWAQGLNAGIEWRY